MNVENPKIFWLKLELQIHLPKVSIKLKYEKLKRSRRKKRTNLCFKEFPKTRLTYFSSRIYNVNRTI